MATPQDPESANGEPPFEVVVRDLADSEYYVQVIPEFNISGPVILGTKAGQPVMVCLVS